MANIVRRENGAVRNRLLSPFFEEFFNMPLASFDSSGWPRADVRETADELTLLFEVPGMKREDLHVAVENNVLTVSGERRTEFDDSDESWVRREISTGSFRRQFTLPGTVDQNSFKAEYRDGILKLKIAKKEEARPRQIEVMTS